MKILEDTHLGHLSLSSLKLNLKVPTAHVNSSSV